MKLAMGVLKTNNVDGKQLRLIEDNYVDSGEIAQNDFTVFTNEYKVQIKVLWFWITIKTYGYTYDIYCDDKIVQEESNYQKQCAEELFDFIINN
jgi:hypothetical protein